MVQYTQARLDDTFAALSDVTRRGVLERLGRSDASITDLADRFEMTLTGMKKHVGVLEEAGLVTTERSAACGLASSARAGWRRRRPGSSDIASSGPRGSMRWNG
jgi:predicted ArsR family transcriptional regulator